MIRDPSDGSVKEITPEANKINAVAPKTAAKEIGPDTGIRQPARTDAQQRLERSRQWLKDYHAKRGVSHADGGANTEANGGVRASSQGLEQQGDSPEAQRQSADGRGSSG